MSSATDYITSTARVAMMVFAVCIAYANNVSGRRFGPILCALVFTEIYLIQFFVRYFVFKEEGYGLKHAGFMKERPIRADSPKLK